MTQRKEMTRYMNIIKTVLFSKILHLQNTGTFNYLTYVPNRKINNNSMIIDYVNRLKELQEDRSRFEKQKDRSNYKQKINKQESKYQAYIIDQMNDKNKLVAAAKIQGILTREVNRVNSSVLQAVSEIKNKEIVKSYSSRSSFTEVMDRDESVTVNFILVKLCTDAIKRAITKVTLEKVRDAFADLHRFSKKKRILEKTAKVMQCFNLRHSFRRILAHDTRQWNHLETQNKLFDESFSVIYKNDRQKDKRGPVGMSESYLSFIFDKDSVPQADLASQRQSGLIIARQREEIASLHEDLSYLRTVLAQKTLQLKKKSLQCDRLLEQAQVQHESGHQSSGNESRSSSYYSEMQRELTGGRRIRKNVSQLNESSPSLKGEQISRELLSKYMKQSFKQKETMDLARDLCIQLSQKLRPQLKREMQAVIKTLSFGEEVSIVDEV